MNQYRCIYQYDEYCEFECIPCKGRFIAIDGPIGWECCPFCMVVWDGMFTKVNKRWSKYDYSRDKSYDVLPDGSWYCHEPRIIVQRRQFVNSKLDAYSFSVVSCKASWTPWHLCTHGNINARCRDSSVSVLMFKIYKEIALRTYGDNSVPQQKRIILQKGSDITVIKQE